jgi:hypothetical protein
VKCQNAKIITILYAFQETRQTVTVTKFWCVVIPHVRLLWVSFLNEPYITSEIESSESKHHMSSPTSTPPSARKVKMSKPQSTQTTRAPTQSSVRATTPPVMESSPTSPSTPPRSRILHKRAKPDSESEDYVGQLSSDSDHGSAYWKGDHGKGKKQKQRGAGQVC